jgi:hypothetical protein
MRELYKFKLSLLLLLLALFCSVGGYSNMQSVARKWNEALLFSIRGDFARPTVHARNLFHTSIAMYDAWAVYDQTASTFLLGRTVGGFNSSLDYFPMPVNTVSAQEEAISYACYRLLKQRFLTSPGATFSLAYYDSLMNEFGYPIDFISTDYSSGLPAAMGNYIAAQVIAFGFQDGSNQQNGYANQYYTPANPQLIVNNSGNATLVDPNRWQQIFLDQFIDQSGNVITTSPPFLSPEWGNVTPFSLTEDDKTIYERDGDIYQVYHDPGMPPLIDTNQISGLDSPYKFGFLLVSVWQSHLDPADNVLWDISPASIGNNTALPDSFSQFPDFYNLFEGGDQSQGWSVNPVTGLPYEPQMVPRGDYARVLAEFWADGPSSETPPGHWFSILNYVNDHPQFEKRWNGQGEILSDLEWDVKSYLTLGGAMHDAAICAWGIKGWYDYPRPVSIIRWMAEKGQSSDSLLPRFHPAGMPLVPGYVELVQEGDSLVGDNNEHLNKIKLYTWKGHGFIDNQETDMAGVGWILAENWWPYQRPSFVTPPFAGYISGHSTFSRTAAEVMTLITGSNFFPGGVGEFHAEMNEFLEFEEGPSQTLTLQWATYQDASDQCSLSRIWGGIHPPQDDIAGRKIGIVLGPEAFNYAESLAFAGKPYVTNVEFNQTIFSELNIGQEYFADIEFNEAMHQGSSPEIDFSGLTGFSVVDYTWLDSVKCRLTFVFTDENEDEDSLLVHVYGALDVSMVEQKDFYWNSDLKVDTRNPQLVNSIINSNDIHCSMIGNGAFTITAVFDELMDISVPIEIEFVSGMPVVSLIENQTNSFWVDSVTYLKTYDVADMQEVCGGIQVEFSGGKDILGNSITAQFHEGALSIETEQPYLVSVLSSSYTVDLETAVVGNLDVVLAFHEAMDMNVIPELEWISDSSLQGVLDVSAESGWLNPFLFLQRYTIDPLAVNIEGIDLSIRSAVDVVGNIMVDDTLADFIDITLDVNDISVLKNPTPIFYPNPVISGQLVYLKNSIIADIDVQLCQMDGKLIKEYKVEANKNSGTLFLDTSDLKAGVYLIKQNYKGDVSVSRLVVVN